MAIAITKSERAVLEMLWNTPDKKKSFSDICIFSAMTIRGVRRVLHRMENDLLISRMEKHGFAFTITFKGMKALGVTERGLCGASGSLPDTGSSPVLSANA